MHVGAIGLKYEIGNDGGHYLEGIGLIVEVLGDEVDEPEEGGNQIVTGLVDAKFFAN